MPRAAEQAIDLARDIYLQLAGEALTPATAKLYSQHTRVTAKQASLTLWRPDEANERLNDAVRLIEAAFMKREADDSDWHLGMRRAGELLEWLAHPEFKLEDTPIRMLAAAAYQVAGYPAMSAGLFDKGFTDDRNESTILQALLKSDFPSLLTEIVAYWQTYKLIDLRTNMFDFSSDDTEKHRTEDWVVRQIVSALGVLCAQARWGNESRFDTAIRKIEKTSDLFLYTDAAYSWLLSRLVAEMGNSLSQRLLRNYLLQLADRTTDEGKKALELYARNNYLERRALLWPSQAIGIDRLKKDESFALCTPTGSGKTTVAEVAVLLSLFQEALDGDAGALSGISPLAMYLVPSKALAAEAESKLSKVLRRVSSQEDPVTVTGLYGGTDWGPTDAWLTREGKTVLICTYEKAEALIRFLGPLFLDRLSLVVIDEAHSVDFNNRYEELYHAESRALRLESLGTRLFSYIAQKNVRVIALSAVAGGINNTLASWVEGKRGAEAVSLNYRSTRQLVGRLECLANRRFEIRYDLLDGSNLQFSERGESDTPFVRDPFPPYPPVPALEREGPEKKLRPYLFWAAMHLTKSGMARGDSTVLIFAPQSIGGYAEDFLTLLEDYWKDVTLPVFFEQPTDPDKLQLWERCLNSCSDYFTRESREYRLLAKGVVVHHGKMPRLLSRLLVEVIEERIVKIVLSTSTLSEGVNLPFEVLLVPTLRRAQGYLSPREFANLVGRTGRPGVATEGRSLVLLPQPASDGPSRRAWERYHDIVSGLIVPVDTTGTGLSPLAELLNGIKTQWELLPGSSHMSFEHWLEETKPLDFDGIEEDSSNPALDSLDSLDSILLSIIFEIEELSRVIISPSDLEERLKQIWCRTYAHYASSIEVELSRIFVKRGKALVSIYSSADQRRRLYKTSMPARHGNMLLSLYPDVKEYLAKGSDFAEWSKADRFAFINELVGKIRTHPRFKGSDTVGKGAKAPYWSQVLEWWLNPKECKLSPEPKNVSDWYDFVYRNFDYRFNWGLSSILSIVFDDSVDDKTKPLTLEDWPLSKLPWIGFWIKELIVWGTLDPVAAFLMSRRYAWTREEAETIAEKYYTEGGDDPNELLNPSNIRDWSTKNLSRSRKSVGQPGRVRYEVELLRDFSEKRQTEWRVIPVIMEDAVVWLDVGGFPLAKSKKPPIWDSDYLNTRDFVLLSHENSVVSNAYV